MTRPWVTCSLMVTVLWVGGCDGFFTTENKSGVRMGATVEEVEKAMGPATAVLPNFGRELRTYKAASGNSYLITFEDGKVVEIN